MLTLINNKLTTGRNQFFDNFADRLILNVNPQSKSTDSKLQSNILSSLLFQTIYEYAEKGLTPLLICIKSEIEQNPPIAANMNLEIIEPSSSNISWSPSVLNRIQIKYVETAHDVKILMASIHAFRPSINALFFLNVHRIVDPSNRLSPQDAMLFDKAVQVIRFIDDAVHCIQQNATSNEEDVTAIADSKNSQPSTAIHTEGMDIANLRLVIANDTCNATFNHLLKQISQKSSLLLSEKVSPKSSSISNTISGRYLDSQSSAPTFSLHLRVPVVDGSSGNKEHNLVTVCEEISVSTVSNTITLR